jgi:stress response protein YsnF
MTHDESQIVIPLHAEEATVVKRRVVTGRVQVSAVTLEREALVDEDLSREHVEIVRTQIGKPLDRMPAVREDGDTLIIPVVEEVLVVERRLLLKEEVRIRRVCNTEKHQERVIVRKQETVITRLPGEAQPVAGSSEPEETPRKEKSNGV